jgi:hypothetical protein
MRSISTAVAPFPSTKMSSSTFSFCEVERGGREEGREEEMRGEWKIVK